jgi:dTDP-4-amino-4,6-dideoxygalactose transaminase
MKSNRMRRSDGSHSTRRTFVQSAAAGFGAGGVTLQARESLALFGGPRAISISPEKAAAVAKWPRYGDGEKNAINALLESNKWYAEIPVFEKELKDHLRVPFVKSHMNATSALMSMFFALDFEPGSEILAPSYTAWATTAPMHLFRYVPVFVDVNPRTMTFDLDYAKKRVNSRTRAILVMHSFGNPCDMDQICAFAKEKGLVVLEDAAQAQGASLQGKPVGTWGSIGVFSFQSSKVLPSIEGGAAAYQTREHYERATTFGNYELPNSFPADSRYRVYQGTGFGPKLRIHPLAASIARQQLQKLDTHNAMVDNQLRQLNGRLAELPGVSHPYTRPEAKRVYWASNLIFIDEQKAGCRKDALIKALRAEGVQASDGSYDEQHRYKLYSEPKWWHHPVVIPDDLHGTAQVNRQAVRLPIFHEEAPELLAQYVKAFEKVWANRSQLS